MKALVPANAVTDHIKTVRGIEKCDKDALRRLFTGDSGYDLYVTSGDWVISQGLSLKTKDDDMGLRANQWTHQFKSYAAEFGDADNPDIVRLTYAGITIWNVEWLAANFPAIRERVRHQYETKKFW
jgi:hypothetical protein